MENEESYSAHEWLGVQQGDPLAAVFKAYARRSKDYHPENSTRTEESQQIFAKLTNAFCSLLNASDHELKVVCNDINVTVAPNTYCCTITLDKDSYHTFKDKCEKYYPGIVPTDRGHNGTQYLTEYRSPGDENIAFGTLSLTFYVSTFKLHVQGSAAFLWVAETLPLIQDIPTLEEWDENSILILDESSATDSSTRTLRSTSANEVQGAAASISEDSATTKPKGKGRQSKGNASKNKCKSEKCKGKQGAQIRCMLCMGWFHNGCVNEPEDYLGSWTCSGCRTLPLIVAQLQAQLSDISKYVVTAQSPQPKDLEKENSILSQKVKQLEAEKSSLTQKVQHLQLVNSNMNKLIETMSAPTPPPPKDDPPPSEPTIPTSNRFENLPQEDGDDVPTEPPPQNNQPHHQHKKIDLTVISSSMGRGAAELLAKDRRFDTSGYVYPGECARQINGRIKNVPCSDVTVVMAGTIDIERRKVDECKEEVRKVMDNISRKRKGKTVIMSELALRTDKPYLNAKIKQVNTYLHDLALNYENVHMLEIDNGRGDLRDGLHFSAQGMGKFCLNIRAKLRELNMYSCL